MATIIKINFTDFKELSENKRVFYYRGIDYFDFIYIIEGIIVKSSVLNSDIENPKQFFSDPLFYNAKPLVFSVPDPTGNKFTDIVGIKQSPVNFIDAIQDEEAKVAETDIQQKGVKIDGGDNSG